MTREEMILNNQGLVGYVIKKLHLSNIFFEVYDLGLIGLINAVDTYDEKKGIFSSYAYMCIEHEITHYLRKKRFNTVSLDEDLFETKKLKDMIRDEYDLEKDVEKREMISYIYDNFNCLNEKEIKCLIWNYGLFGNEKQCQSDIAKKLNVSQPHVSRMINSAIKKLREAVM